nr:restriction endonuclease subunit S [Micromonospora sp. DSM 115978]
MSADQYAAAGVRLVRTSDVSERGTLVSAAGAVYVDERHVRLDDRYRLRTGDVLLSRSGTLGRSLLVQPDAAGSTFAGYLVRFRPNPDVVDPRFLAYLTASAGFQDAVRADAVASTIQNFNAERYANIALSVPPLAVQRHVADHLDAATARVDRLCDLRERQLELVHARLVSYLVDALVDEVSVARTCPPGSRRHTRLQHLFEFERAGVWGTDPAGPASSVDSALVRCVRVADFRRDEFRAGASATTWRRVAS